MKKTMQQINAISLTNKIQALQTALDKAMTSGQGRAAYNTMIELSHTTDELADIYATNTVDDSVYTIAQTITYYSLKVLARGRKVKNPKADKTHTPCNMLAMDILKYGRHDTSGILEDLTSAVYLNILQAITDNAITIDENNHMQLVDDTDATRIKVILNTVQSELYRHAERHYKHRYDVQYDNDGNEIDATMYTAAQRQYDLSIESIGSLELIRQLTVKLTDNERLVLASKLQKKQVERNYTSNGKQKKHYVSRYLTLSEISENTGISVQSVRTCLNSIQRKCQNLLDN